MNSRPPSYRLYQIPSEIITYANMVNKNYVIFLSFQPQPAPRELRIIPARVIRRSRRMN